MKNLLFLLPCLFCTSSCSEPPADEASSRFKEAPASVSGNVAPPLVHPLLPDSNNPLSDSGRHAQAALSAGKFTSREDLVAFARRFLGTPYIYAGNNPDTGFDCSGFIYYVYHHFGFPVPRSSIDFKNYGREVLLTQAKVADLILFTGAEDTDRIGHIGIVLQGGNDTTSFIHASSGAEMSVTISSAGTPHYRKRFVKVVDVISK